MSKVSDKGRRGQAGTAASATQGRPLTASKREARGTAWQTPPTRSRKVDPPALVSALELLANDFWPVPIYPPVAGPKGVGQSGKAPIGKAWGKTRHTPGSLRQAWARTPGASVGLLLGKRSGMIDVEVDDPATGYASRATLFGGEEVPTVGWASQRGDHQLFAWDDRLERYGATILKEQLKEWLPGLEVRIGSLTDAADAKQFQSVCPPSLVTIEEEDQAIRVTGERRAWNGVAELGRLPDAFFDTLDRLFETRLPDPELARDEFDRLSDVAPRGPEVISRYVRAALERELAALATTREGGRNDRLNKAAFALGQFVGAGVLSRGDVEPALACTGRAIGLPEAEVVRTIQSGLESGIARPRDLSQVGRSRNGPRSHRPAGGNGEDGPTGGRQSEDIPEVVISTSEHQVVDEAVAAMANDPGIYQRSYNLVHVLRDESRKAQGVIRPPGTPIIRPIPMPVLRTHLTQFMDWKRLSKGDDGTWERTAAHPPEWAVAAIFHQGSWPNVRDLQGVIETPVLKPDGTVLDVPGYDLETGLLYEPNPQTSVMGEAAFQQDIIIRLRAIPIPGHGAR